MRAHADAKASILLASLLSAFPSTTTAQTAPPPDAFLISAHHAGQFDDGMSVDDIVSIVGVKNVV